MQTQFVLVRQGALSLKERQLAYEIDTGVSTFRAVIYDVPDTHKQAVFFQEWYGTVKYRHSAVTRLNTDNGETQWLYEPDEAIDVALWLSEIIDAEVNHKVYSLILLTMWGNQYLPAIGTMRVLAFEYKAMQAMWRMENPGSPQPEPADLGQWVRDLLAGGAELKLSDAWEDSLDEIDWFDDDLDD